MEKRFHALTPRPRLSDLCSNCWDGGAVVVFAGEEGGEGMMMMHLWSIEESGKRLFGWTSFVVIDIL